MSTAEIKGKLIQAINSSDNKNLLEEFYHYLSQGNNIQAPYRLSNEQQLAVSEARTQIANGDYLDNDQADEEIEEWLKK